MRKTLVLVSWLFSSCLLLAVSTTTLHFLSKPQRLENQVIPGKQAVTQPQTNPLPNQEQVKGVQTSVKIGDARALIIEQYLAKYQSPMAGYASHIVATANQLADKYQLDATQLAYLTIAIAQNESNLGKRMPPNCFNAWGWGIHSAGTLCFDSWEDGITQYMSGLAEKYFYQQGLTTPAEIMTRYTPHSPGGAWAKNVAHFLKQIETARF